MSIGTKEFSDLIYDKLIELGEEVKFTKPNVDSKYPYREIMVSSKNTEKLNILYVFKISIKHWNEQPYNLLEMSDKTDKKLLENNLIRTNTSECIYDETLEKYELTTTYEVKYNALSNAFQTIK